ncbi:YdeI/OmpD-associated family protein [Flavobacteriaceae bacterium XHP0103]|uniref:YdeI/OmpD-associated family protein n=1 Tax=Marixanthotalea marina TaxID=2844359 RepID=UPI002989CD48|nr:YdeI/OmpD-associated family protein [Marixanthotalea marina]MBU3821477.1 YdeI/OmpD-associated family protein [Marixanthotalea marina]
MNPEVDAYFIDGCGRCNLYATPECKVHSWAKELKLLRSLVLSCGLTEELKWSQPCYTNNDKNILLVTAFKDYCCISFFKGVLLKDEQNILEAPGENTQSGRLFKFTNVNQIKNNEALIKAYIFEAVEIEKAGLKVAFKKNPEPIPIELKEAFKTNPELKTAFEALTPGRQRGYILHFSQAKQSKTRVARIKKYIPKILAGKGFHD